MTATTPPVADTVVSRLMRNPMAVRLLSMLPIPLVLARSFLLRDNAVENHTGWQRLRDPSEAPRYEALRKVTEHHAGNGFVLDVGCGQGILAEGLTYRRYLGVDNCRRSIAIAEAKSDQRTRFVCADGSRFVADEPPTAVVLSEVIYYLPDPVAAVHHYTRQLAPGGVVIVSIYQRAWSSRRLLRTLARRFELLESRLVKSDHLAWIVATFRAASPTRTPASSNRSGDPLAESARGETAPSDA